MYYEYPGGSSIEIGFEDQVYKIHLPPVGMVRNVLTGDMEPRAILYEHLKPEDRMVPRKRLKPKPPDDWKQWRAEEKRNQKRDPEWTHPMAEEYRQQEWDRRLNGVWISIYNPKTKEPQPVYLTGLHYFYCFHWKCDFGMPDFRHIDTEIFYLLQFTEEDPFSNGLTLATLRRLGKTSILGCWLYEYPSRTYNAYSGFQSKTRDDAKKVFTQSIIYPWKNLVDFFRPQFDYNSTQSQDLSFLAPTPKGKSAIAALEEDDTSLHSVINFRDAGLYSYDGYKLHRYGAEEPGKTTEVDIHTRHGIVRPCTEVGGDIVGQMFAPTTVEDIEGQSADKYKKLFDESKYGAKTANGKTLSGLYSYFIPAYRGYKFDEYGWSMEEESKEFLLNERKAREHDPEALAAFIRKYPFTVDEAFMAGKGICVFNEFILNQRFQELDRMPHPPYRVGDLDWHDEIDGDVMFVDNPDGKFLFSHFPDIEVQNQVGQDSYGDYRPRNDNRYAIATDPISHSKSADPRSSKAAAHGFWKRDLNYDHLEKNEKEWDSHMWCFEYLHRPDEVEDYFEDMIKACRFLGCQILYESQKNNIGQYFRQRGYKHFLMYRPESTFTDDTGRQLKEGIPASKETIDMYVHRLRTFINRHGHRIPFKRTIAQLLRFDPKKTTEFDLAVSSGWSMIALEKIVEQTAAEFQAQDWFDLYDISGTESKRIA